MEIKANKEESKFKIDEYSESCNIYLNGEVGYQEFTMKEFISEMKVLQDKYKNKEDFKICFTENYEGLSIELTWSK